MPRNHLFWSVKIAWFVTGKLQKGFFPLLFWHIKHIFSSEITDCLLQQILNDKSLYFHGLKIPTTYLCDLLKRRKKPVPYHGLLFPFLFSPLKMFLIAFPRPWTARPSNNNQDYQVLPVKTNNKSRNPKKTSFWYNFYVCLRETTYT